MRSGMEPQRRLLKAAVKSYQKRLQPKKHYVFVIEVQWSDHIERKVMTVRRSHEEFFIFHCRLVDKFPLDASQRGGLIPSLPGRKFLGRTNTSAVARKRVPQLQAYIEELLRLPDYISQCDLLHKFFTPTVSDYKLADMQRVGTAINDQSRDKSEAGSFCDGSDGDDDEEEYLASVATICDYDPRTQDENGPSWEEQLTFSRGETLYVLSLDCPNGFWQARNSEGEIGYIPCKYVNLEDCEMRPRSGSKLGRRLSITTPRQRNRVMKRAMNSSICLYYPTDSPVAGRHRRSLSPELGLSTRSSLSIPVIDFPLMEASKSPNQSPTRRALHSSCQSLASPKRQPTRYLSSQCLQSPKRQLKPTSSSPPCVQSPKRMPKYASTQCLQSATQSFQPPRRLPHFSSARSLNHPQPFAKESSPVIRVPVAEEEEDSMTGAQLSGRKLNSECGGGPPVAKNKHLEAVKECPLEKSPSQVLRSAIMDVITQLDGEETQNQDEEEMLPSSNGSDMSLSRNDDNAELVLRDKPRRADHRSSRTDSFYMDSQSLDSAYASEHGNGRLDSPGRCINGNSTDSDTIEVELPLEVANITALVEGEPYRVKESYTPRETSGLVVQEGEVIVVTAKLDDGWWCGHSCNSGKGGWFPSALVEKA